MKLKRNMIKSHLAANLILVLPITNVLRGDALVLYLALLKDKSTQLNWCMPLHVHEN